MAHPDFLFAASRLGVPVVGGSQKRTYHKEAFVGRAYDL
jgi:hypothetical protein